ncbi:MAG: hypothetical protein WCT01_00610 [Candidatus Shapirobacteria bacterium]
MPIEARQIDVGGTTVNVVGAPQGCAHCPRIRPVLEHGVGITRDSLINGKETYIRFVGLSQVVNGYQRVFETKLWTATESREPLSYSFGLYCFGERCPEGCGGEQQPEGEWVFGKRKDGRTLLVSKK